MWLALVPTCLSLWHLSFLSGHTLWALAHLIRQLETPTFLLSTNLPLIGVAIQITSQRLFEELRPRTMLYDSKSIVIHQKPRVATMPRVGTRSDLIPRREVLRSRDAFARKQRKDLSVCVPAHFSRYAWRPIRSGDTTPNSKRVLESAVKRATAINMIDCRRASATNLANNPLPFRCRGP